MKKFLLPESKSTHWPTCNYNFDNTKKNQTVTHIKKVNCDKTKSGKRLNQNILKKKSKTQIGTQLDKPEQENLIVGQFKLWQNWKSKIRKKSKTYIVT